MLAMSQLGMIPTAPRDGFSSHATVSALIRLAYRRKRQAAAMRARQPRYTLGHRPSHARPGCVSREFVAVGRPTSHAMARYPTAGACVCCVALEHEPLTLGRDRAGQPTKAVPSSRRAFSSPFALLVILASSDQHFRSTSAHHRRRLHATHMNACAVGLGLTPNIAAPAPRETLAA